MILDYVYYYITMTNDSNDSNDHINTEYDKIQNYDDEIYFILLSLTICVLIQK
jgi:hypothetical protein